MLTNTGSSSVTLNSISITGDPSSFSTTNSCSNPLPTNQACNVNVTFTPASTGAHNGNLQIVSSAVNSPTVVALSGNGTSSLGAASFSPISTTFADTSVGVTSQASVILTNSGSGYLTINGVSVANASGNNFSASSQCPADLHANSNCSIVLYFSPKITGAQSATLQVYVNGTSTPYSYSISGNGK